jgi:hypothetical protein
MYCKALSLSFEKYKYYKKLRIDNYLLHVSDMLLEFQKEGKHEYVDNPELKSYVHWISSSDEMTKPCVQIFEIYGDGRNIDDGPGEIGVVDVGRITNLLLRTELLLLEDVFGCA